MIIYAIQSALTNLYIYRMIPLCTSNTGIKPDVVLVHVWLYITIKKLIYAIMKESNSMQCSILHNTLTLNTNINVSIWVKQIIQLIIYKDSKDSLKSFRKSSEQNSYFPFIYSKLNLIFFILIDLFYFI